MEPRFKKLLLDQEPISPEKYSEYDSNEPRNVLASAINPVLDEYVNPTLEKIVSKVNKYSPVEIAGNVRIPEVSKGETEEYARNFAQNAATGMIGGVGKGNAAATAAIKESIEKRLAALQMMDDKLPWKANAVADLQQSLKNLANTGSQVVEKGFIPANQGSGKFGKIIVKP